MSATAHAAPRLAALARRREQPRAPDPERCELCGEPLSAEHRHLLDTASGELMCACRACSLLFEDGSAGGGRYLLVGDRRLRIEDFRLDEPAWAALQIPVEMAFFFHSSAAGRVLAFYPGPMGATESLLELRGWATLVAENPVLEQMQPDTEALLINRARGASEHWLLPVTDCYALAGVIRTRWRGLTGGREVWSEIERFFGGLAARGTMVRRDGSTHTITEAR